MTDRPPRYAFMTRMYNSNLRPIVLTTTFVVGIWSLVWAIGFFREISSDKGDGFTRLATFALILGIIYSAVTAIEAFGFAAALLQRLALIRLFSFAALAAALLLVAAGFMRVILHFLLKSDLLSDCVKEVSGQTVDFSWGIWGPRDTETLTGQQATDWCNDAFSHDSWSEILYLIAVILIMASVTSVAWAFARQAKSAPLGSGGGRSFALAAPAGAANPYYQPPYAASGADFAPPPGPPPPRFAPPKGEDDYDDESDRGTLPGYGAGADLGVKDAKYFEGDAKARADENPFADFEERR